ncbi:MAG: acetyl-CoA carboxyl transferase [Chlamydiae bacterium SM23_39]|nr:MAG: acetyl-CoA carboxyl transferase [Chlamydiae bacterium SM23_39]
MIFFSKNKPKIKVESTKKDKFSGWLKCTKCDEMIHIKELQEKLNCCPKCSYHYKISSKERIDLLVDEGSFQVKFDNIKSKDFLKFVDSKPYEERLREGREKSNVDEAAVVGTCKIGKIVCCLGVLDFGFMGGSMGSVVGERITSIIEYACLNNLSLVIVSASGGARMQESVLSLMQMVKTSQALAKLDESRLPFISVLTNPTTGGVIASFASLGDIILAEPDALIGFAGPRVIEQTIKEKLPENAQKSEFLLEKGMIDLVVPRIKLKEKIVFFLDFLINNKKEEKKLLEELLKKDLE